MGGWSPPHGATEQWFPGLTAGPKKPPEPPSSEQVRRAVVLLVMAVVVGLVVDLGLRGGGIGVGSALVVTAFASGLMIAGKDRLTERWVFAALAVVFATGLVFRTSPWIVALDWLAALGLLGLAASATPGRSMVGSSLVRLMWRGAAPPGLATLAGPAELLGSIDVIRRRPRPEDGEVSAARRMAPAIARGVALAAPILLGLGMLLAAADGVFASFFDVPVPDLGSPASLIRFGLGACFVAGLVRWTRDPQDPTVDPKRPLGPVETLIVLGGLACLYALFAVAQVVASAGGDDRVQDTTGLTYAEYARSGFFQLLWAAAITIVVLLGVRALARPGGRPAQLAVRAVSVITCLLTLVVVGSAISRLELYRDAYGLTMLRLASTTFAWVLGAAFVLLGARMVQPKGRDWLPAAYLALAVVTLGWWNVSNPEVTVVETNIDHAIGTAKLDVDYLDTMSDDAVPALVDGLDRLPEPLASDLRQRLCTHTPEGSFASPRNHVDVDEDGQVRSRSGWAAFNVARSAAVEAIEGCATETASG